MKTLENILSDHRINRCKKHKLETIVLIVIYATLKKVYGYQKIAEFAKQHAKDLENYMDLSHGCPSTVTLWRNFERINIRRILEYIELNKDLLNVLMSFQHTYAPDNRSPENKDTHTQSNLEIIRSHINKHYVHICDQRECTQPAPEKQKVVHEILEKLVTKNSIVAVASKHNSPYTAHLIKKKQGDYLLEVNPSNLYLFEQVKDQLDRHIQLVDDKKESYLIQQGEIQKTRRVYCLEHQLRWIEGIEKWPQVKCMIAIEEAYCKGNECSWSINYYLSSISEWSVEKIHSLTEYHFHKPCSWSISFKIECIPKGRTSKEKVLKSNLLWIQRERFDWELSI